MSVPLKVLQKILCKTKYKNKDDVDEEENRNPSDHEAIKKLRELLKLQLDDRNNSNQITDDHTLLRFLHMTDYDISKAKDSFLNHLKWREEFGVEKISKEFNFDEYEQVQKYYPHGFHGVDRSGNPVYIERMGLIDLTTLLEKTSLERLVKHHVYEQENTLNVRFPACSIAAGKRIGSTTAILDVKGIGASSFSKQARYLLMEIQHIDSNYYPDTLNRLYVVNAGSGFRLLWKALRTSLDAHTAKKIQVLGSNYKSKLIEVIDPSNLPSFLGGNCTCSEQGGCMISDKGPWNDPKILEILESLKDNKKNAYDNHTNVEEVWLSAESTPDNTPLSLSETIKQMKITVEEAESRFRAIEVAVAQTKQVLQRFSEKCKEFQMKALHFEKSGTI
ncbi:phosphatidylinositol/phosphatidylcholine transfer protein SFH11 [Amaranthus tricolor]|uniref:phosphatidylinositol/phosphatidylcholine transfer protein SFH11 n=1 Tax=Amaranthus tricolor TaxID=29722 RepID=UPI0025826B0F|nr:phosphatidylinositol/phosphatidylcholine transfer protein SFH11 [Amaranthus tricolor]